MFFAASCSFLFGRIFFGIIAPRSSLRLDLLGIPSEITAATLRLLFFWLLPFLLIAEIEVLNRLRWCCRRRPSARRGDTIAAFLCATEDPAFRPVTIALEDDDRVNITNK